VMPNKTAAIPVVLVAAAAVLVVWFVIANSTRRVEEVMVTVEAVTAGPASEGQSAPERTAMILMPDGRRLYARIATAEAVRPGQKAKIVVTEQLISGTRTYEIIDIVDAP
jgi:uncharacterized OB-fold protein